MINLNKLITGYSGAKHIEYLRFNKSKKSLITFKTSKKAFKKKGKGLLPLDIKVYRNYGNYYIQEEHARANTNLLSFPFVFLRFKSDINK